METFMPLFIPLVFLFLLIRLMMMPTRRICRFSIHCGSGLICLLLLNSVSARTGFLFPCNAVTVAIAGFGGLPGIAAIALLAWLA